MELRQLKYFCTVAELNSLTAAADRLNVTQPAVGMQIRKLEEGLDLKLMHRHSRGVRLTPAGKIMLEHAREILGRVDTAQRALGRVRNDDAAEIRIGVTPSLSMVFVPKLMEVCHDRFPEISLIFFQGFPSELIAEFDRGTTDFCFTNRDIDTENAESVPLYLEDIRLIGAAEEVAKLPDPLPTEALEDLPLVLDGRDSELSVLLSREMRRLGRKLTNVIEVKAIPLRRNYATKQRRFCVAPAALFHAELISGQCATLALDVPGMSRCLQLVGPRVEFMTAAEANVRAMVVEIVEEMVAEGSYEWRLPEDQQADIRDSSSS